MVAAQTLRPREQGIPTLLFAGYKTSGVRFTTPPYPFSLDSFQAKEAKWKIFIEQQIKRWGQLMQGLHEGMQEPSLSPPQCLYTG